MAGESASTGMGGLLPRQAGVTSGWALVTDGTEASWASVGGGASLILGAVGSAPNADGATYDSGTGDFNLEPADATHPGVLTSSTQTIGGDKTFLDDILPNDDGTTQSLGSTTKRWLAASFVTGYFRSLKDEANTGNVLVSGAFIDSCAALNTTLGGGELHLQIAGSTKANLLPTTFDFTGLGNGGSIKLKSPDGTTYTATIANGGTWSIT